MSSPAPISKTAPEPVDSASGWGDDASGWDNEDDDDDWGSLEETGQSVSVILLSIWM